MQNPARHFAQRPCRYAYGKDNQRNYHIKETVLRCGKRVQQNSRKRNVHSNILQRLYAFSGYYAASAADDTDRQHERNRKNCF